MAAPIALNDADLVAADSLEKQTAFFAVKLQQAEAAASTPEAPKNRITLSPNYDSNVLSITLSLPLNAGAVATTLVEGVNTYI